MSQVPHQAGRIMARTEKRCQMSPPAEPRIDKQPKRPQITQISQIQESSAHIILDLRNRRNLRTVLFYCLDACW